MSREEIELCLKADLEDAETRLRNATPQEKEKARTHFREALHRFSEFVFEDRAPLMLVRKSPE